MARLKQVKRKESDSGSQQDGAKKHQQTASSSSQHSAHHYQHQHRLAPKMHAPASSSMHSARAPMHSLQNTISAPGFNRVPPFVTAGPLTFSADAFFRHQQQHQHRQRFPPQLTKLQQQQLASLPRGLSMSEFQEHVRKNYPPRHAHAMPHNNPYGFRISQMRRPLAPPPATKVPKVKLTPARWMQEDADDGFGALPARHQVEHDGEECSDEDNAEPMVRGEEYQSLEAQDIPEADDDDNGARDNDDSVEPVVRREEYEPLEAPDMPGAVDNDDDDACGSVAIAAIAAQHHREAEGEGEGRANVAQEQVEGDEEEHRDQEEEDDDEEEQQQQHNASGTQRELPSSVSSASSSSSTGKRYQNNTHMSPRTRRIRQHYHRQAVAVQQRTAGLSHGIAPLAVPVALRETPFVHSQKDLFEILERKHQEYMREYNATEDMHARRQCSLAQHVAGLHKVISRMEQARKLSTWTGQHERIYQQHESRMLHITREHKRLEEEYKVKNSQALHLFKGVQQRLQAEIIRLEVEKRNQMRSEEEEEEHENSQSGSGGGESDSNDSLNGGNDSFETSQNGGDGYVDYSLVGGENDPFRSVSGRKVPVRAVAEPSRQDASDDTVIDVSGHGDDSDQDEERARDVQYVNRLESQLAQGRERKNANKNGAGISDDSDSEEKCAEQLLALENKIACHKARTKDNVGGRAPNNRRNLSVRRPGTVSNKPKVKRTRKKTSKFRHLPAEQKLMLHATGVDLLLAQLQAKRSKEAGGSSSDDGAIEILPLPDPRQAGNSSSISPLPVRDEGKSVRSLINASYNNYNKNYEKTQENMKRRSNNFNNQPRDRVGNTPEARKYAAMEEEGAEGCSDHVRSSVEELALSEDMHIDANEHASGSKDVEGTDMDVDMTEDRSLNHSSSKDETVNTNANASASGMHLEKTEQQKANDKERDRLLKILVGYVTTANSRGSAKSTADTSASSALGAIPSANAGRAASSSTAGTAVVGSTLQGDAASSSAVCSTPSNEVTIVATDVTSADTTTTATANIGVKSVTPKHVDVMVEEEENKKEAENPGIRTRSQAREDAKLAARIARLAKLAEKGSSKSSKKKAKADSGGVTRSGDTGDANADANSDDEKEEDKEHSEDRSWIFDLIGSNMNQKPRSKNKPRITRKSAQKTRAQMKLIKEIRSKQKKEYYLKQKVKAAQVLLKAAACEEKQRQEGNDTNNLASFSSTSACEYEV